ncbi:hypothetical protein ACTL6P_21565 [Endozoicomonas acroporae]
MDESSGIFSATGLFAGTVPESSAEVGQNKTVPEYNCILSPRPGMPDRLH